MHRFAAIFLLSLAVAACSNPFPFGPGRVDVKLEDAAVALVEHATIFPDFPEAASAPKRPPRRVVRLKLSSETDLIKYFKDWDRQLQVRCTVDGNANGKSYSGFATQPFPDGSSNGVTRPSQSAPASEQHLYLIYAFIDLLAKDDEYQDGKPATTLDLKTDQFEALRCHLIGVTKAPVLFPKSNDFVVPAEKFRNLFRQAHFE